MAFRNLRRVLRDLRTLFSPPGLHPLSLRFRVADHERKWFPVQHAATSRGLIAFLLVMVCIRALGDLVDDDEPAVYENIQWLLVLPLTAASLLLLILPSRHRTRPALPLVISLLVISLGAQFALTATHVSTVSAVYLYGSVSLLLVFAMLLLGLPALHSLVSSGLVVVGFMTGLLFNGNATPFLRDSAFYIGILYLALFIAARHTEIVARQNFLATQAATSARAAANEAMRRLQAETESRLSWLRSMSHVLGHELRAPFLLASKSIESARSHLYGNSPESNELDRGQHYLARAISILDATREASSLEGTIQNAERRRHDLARLLERVVEDSSLLYGPDRPLSFCATGVPYVSCSNHLIEQLLEKLLSNAMDFALPGSRVEVDVSVTQGVSDAKYALIRVRNQGPHLAAPPEELFKPFRSIRTGKVAHDRHIGVGLHIALLIAQAHGGDIRAQDITEPNGVEFVVSLPCLTEREQAEQTG